MLNQIKGIIIALAAFALMHFAIAKIANYLAAASSSFQDWLPWINFSTIAIYFICGFLAGMTQSKYFVFVGLATGLFSALISIFIFGVSYSDTQGKLITITTGVIFGSLGGLISKFIKPRLANAL